MKHLLLLLLFVQTSGITAQVYYPMVHPKPFPSYEEVVNQFYLHYQERSEPAIVISKQETDFTLPGRMVTEGLFLIRNRFGRPKVVGKRWCMWINCHQTDL